MDTAACPFRLRVPALCILLGASQVRESLLLNIQLSLWWEAGGMAIVEI
jgi:hypothetical protein